MIKYINTLYKNLNIKAYIEYNKGNKLNSAQIHNT